MKGIFWRHFEPFVQAAITDRILKFYEALIQRGQLPSAPPVGPISEN